MNEIKEIITFISYALHAFFINLLTHLVYFFLGLSLTVAVFFFTFRTGTNQTFFWIYLAALTVLNYILRKRLVSKHQLRLNVMFLGFLEKDARARQVELPGNTRQIIKTINTRSRQSGLTIISTKVPLALAALKIRENTGNKWELQPHSSPSGLLRLQIHHLCGQLALFILILLPFTLISFLFTTGMGVSGPVVYLIYLLGFLFVYFLNAVIVDPIVALMIQKRIYRLLKP